MILLLYRICLVCWVKGLWVAERFRNSWLCKMFFWYIPSNKMQEILYTLYNVLNCMFIIKFVHQSVILSASHLFLSVHIPITLFSGNVQWIWLPISIVLNLQLAVLVTNIIIWKTWILSLGVNGHGTFI